MSSRFSHTLTLYLTSTLYITLYLINSIARTAFDPSLAVPALPPCKHCRTPYPLLAPLLPLAALPLAPLGVNSLMSPRDHSVSAPGRRSTPAAPPSCEPLPPSPGPRPRPSPSLPSPTTARLGPRLPWPESRPPAWTLARRRCPGTPLPSPQPRSSICTCSVFPRIMSQPF